MTCRECREAIEQAANREIEPGRQAALEAHVSACAACRALHEGNRRVAQVLAAAPVPEPPPQLAAHLAALAARALAAEAQRPVVRWSVPAAAAAGLLFGLLVGSQAFPRVVERERVVAIRPPALAAAPPEVALAPLQPLAASQPPTAIARSAAPSAAAAPSRRIPGERLADALGGPVPPEANWHFVSAGKAPAATPAVEPASVAPPAPALARPEPAAGLASMRRGGATEAVAPLPAVAVDLSAADATSSFGALAVSTGGGYGSGAAHDTFSTEGESVRERVERRTESAVASIPVEPDWGILAAATEELNAAAEPIPVFLADRSGGLIAYRSSNERPLARSQATPVFIFTADGGDAR